MPALTELLRVESGIVGDYKWKVMVYRADTKAICNLEVVLEVYRVKRRKILPNSKSRVFSESSTASRSTLEKRVKATVNDGERLSRRFDKDSKKVEELEV